MTYATEQNCIDRFGEDTVVVATDRDNTGLVDPVVLGKALADADATIDSYVSGLPGWPFVSVPDSFEHIACDLAIYYAAQPANAGTDEMRKRFEDCIRYLERVAEQKIRLPQETGTNFVKSDASADMLSTERVMTREALGDLF